MAVKGAVLVGAVWLVQDQLRACLGPREWVLPNVVYPWILRSWKRYNGSPSVGSMGGCRSIHCLSPASYERTAVSNCSSAVSSGLRHRLLLRHRHFPLHTPPASAGGVTGCGGSVEGVEEDDIWELRERRRRQDEFIVSQMEMARQTPEYVAQNPDFAGLVERIGQNLERLRREADTAVIGLPRPARHVIHEEEELF